MNRERMAQLLENLRTIPESAFGMHTIASVRGDGIFSHYEETFRQLQEGENACGTVACIAGRACAIFAPDTPIKEGIEEAARILGLGKTQTDYLFLGDLSPGSLTSISRDEAVAVIEHFMETGEISWAAAGRADVDEMLHDEYSDDDDDDDYED